MQIIVDFGLNFQQYFDLVMTKGVGALVIPGWCLICPFCKKAHFLKKNGSYERNAVDKTLAVILPIRKLLCVSTGQTVSLLPHFLAPGKQHTWEVIGSYLYAREILGWTGKAAMKAATQINPSRQKGESWSRKIKGKLAVIQTYLAGIRPRAVFPTEKSILKALGHRFQSLAEALAFHNAHIRERMGVWLL